MQKWDFLSPAFLQHGKVFPATLIKFNITGNSDLRHQDCWSVVILKQLDVYWERGRTSPIGCLLPCRKRQECVPKQRETWARASEVFTIGYVFSCGHWGNLVFPDICWPIDLGACEMGLRFRCLFEFNTSLKTEAEIWRCAAEFLLLVFLRVLESRRSLYLQWFVSVYYNFFYLNVYAIVWQFWRGSHSAYQFGCRVPLLYNLPSCFSKQHSRQCISSKRERTLQVPILASLSKMTLHYKDGRRVRRDSMGWQDDAHS